MCIKSFGLDRGTYPNAKMSGGFTALSVSAQIGSADTAEALLAAGVNVESKMEDGSTPLIVAAHADHYRYDGCLCKSICKGVEIMHLLVFSCNNLLDLLV